MQTEIGNGNGVTLQKLVGDLKVVVRDSEKLLRVGAGQVRERAIAGARVTDESIRKNPYTSLGIIFGVGMIVGALACNCFGKSNSACGEKNA